MRFEPIRPGLDKLMSLVITLEPPLFLGDVPTGNRRITNITGGEFSGDRLRGEIRAGGADWQLVRNDAVAEVDARYTLETHDGALIYLQNSGFRYGPADVIAALAAGDSVVDPSTYYFRTSARLETSAEAYAWLNRVLCVGSGMRARDHVLMDLYSVA